MERFHARWSLLALGVLLELHVRSAAAPVRSVASTALSKNARRLKIPVSASIDDIHTLLVGRDIAAGANESSGTAPYSPVANS